MTLAGVIALCATGVETGHIYYAYRLLISSTNAATLAGAQAMPNITQAQANVTAYSSQSGQKNANSLFSITSLTTNFYCSGDATNLNVGCQAPPSGQGSCTSGSTCNALTVTQKASVPLWFGGLLGMPQVNMTAQSSAAMRGGTDTPYNIAIIIDTTGSMGTAKAPASDGCGGNAYQITCAVYGLKQFLLEMDPCPLSTNCSTTTAYVDDVALFVFPAVAAGNASKDTTCPTSNPATVPYNFTNVTTTSQDLSLWDGTSGGTTVANTHYQGTYEVVTFNNTYKSTDSDTQLATTGDPLAVAAGAGGGSCQGLQAPGGQDTYYAQVIRQAQAALYTMSGGSTPNGSKNIMIILSDGDAQACNYQAYTPYGGNASCSGNNDIVADNCPAINSSGACISSSQDSTNTCPIGTSKTTLACSGSPLNGTYYKSGNKTYQPSGYNSPTYPSALGECGQAVEAAQMATAAGTTVYTVAMGSETSGGCSTDAQITVSDQYTGSTYGTVSYSAGQQPCQAIQAMASNQKYAIKSNPTFYSDATAGCTAPAGTASYTTIGGIFQAIANGLTNARLIPTGS